MSFIDYLSPLYYFLMNIFTVICTVFIKRNKEIILFGSWYGERFAGNSRFLFQYLAENKEQYNFKKVIWVTRSKELYHELQEMHYEVYMMKSLKSIYYHFKAGTHAVNVNTATSRATNEKRYGDILGVLSMGARRLYLNHAAAATKGNRFLEKGKRNFKDKLIYTVYASLYKLYFFRHWCLMPGGWDKHYYLAASKKNKEGTVVRTPEASQTIYVETTFPELCPCIKYINSEKLLIEKLQKCQKVILYAPTYRTDARTGFVHPLSDEKFTLFLRQNHYLWLEKLHPGAKASMRAPCYDPDCTLELPQQFDLNILMPYIHILITDYSSVYQKAIYYDIPLVFYMPDIKGYKQYDKSLIPNFFNEITGMKTETPTELIDGIKAALDENYLLSSRDEYTYLKELYFDGRKASYESYADIAKSFFSGEYNE